MTRMTGGAAVVEMLRRHGVDTLFALPGVQNDALFAALYDAGDAIRTVHPRHEQGAAYMAYGYARASGKVGAYAVVPGPGLLNTTAALSTAYATNTPVLALSGQIPQAMIGRGFGMLHEIPDQLGVLRGLTKWAARIEHPSEVGTRMNEAFRELASGRRRPVGLEVPLDVLALESELDLPAPAGREPPPSVDPELIAKAAELLGEARRPLIFVGGGAVEAGEALLNVAESLQAPVVANCLGRGILDDRHYLAHTALSGYALWPASTIRRRSGASTMRSRSSASTSIPSRSRASPSPRSASSPTRRRRSKPSSTRSSDVRASAPRAARSSASSRRAWPPSARA